MINWLHYNNKVSVLNNQHKVASWFKKEYSHDRFGAIDNVIEERSGSNVIRNNVFITGQRSYDFFLFLSFVNLYTKKWNCDI